LNLVRTASGSDRVEHCIGSTGYGNQRFFTIEILPSRY
jgi:hypothetical protein